MSSRITQREKRKILRLTYKGLSQKDISLRVRRHRNDVYRVQKRAGLCPPYRGPRLPELSPEEKRKVLERSWRGMGVARIAKELNLREWSVRRVVEAERKRRGLKPKTWHHLPPRELAKLKREILERRNYGRTLAEKYDVEYKFLLRLVHELLGPYHLTPGRTQIPLSSRFPQRHLSIKLGAK